MAVVQLPLRNLNTECTASRCISELALRCFVQSCTPEGGPMPAAQGEVVAQANVIRRRLLERVAGSATPVFLVRKSRCWSLR